MGSLLLVQMLYAQASKGQVPIEEILQLPNEQIDLGKACLILAKDAYPNLDIERFDYVLDYMADQIRRLVQDITDPEFRIGALNTYLYQKGWWNDSLTFTYDLEDLEAKSKHNRFLNGYLSTRKGSCMTMPMLHLVLADRLGWPIRAVRSPKHFFARYIQEGFDENNIEATSGGGYISNRQYMKDVGIPEKAIDNGVYLRTLSKKEYLATLLINNARHYQEREGDLDKAVEYLKLALSVDTTLSSAHWNLGGYYWLQAEQLYKEYRSRASQVTAKAQSELLAIKQPYRSTSDYLNQPVKPKITGSIGYGATIPLPSLPVTEPPQLSLNISNNRNQPSPAKPVFPVKIYEDVLRMEVRGEIASLEEQYLPKIKQLLAQSEFHRRKAGQLGIVLDFPASFFRRQAQSIEEFQATGEYEP